MLSQFWSCAIPLIILLCWLSVNDASPFGPHPGDKVHPTSSSQSHAVNSTRRHSHITTEKQRSGTGTSKSGTDSLPKPMNTRRRNSNINNNININTIHPGLLAPEYESRKPLTKQPIEYHSTIGSRSQSESSEEFNHSNPDDILDSFSELTDKKNPEKTKETPEKCASESRGQNQIYTRSFPSNVSSIDSAEEFKIVGKADAKKTSSVHVGEDIALCWIETTTIKEDPAFDPPKRLVVREFTISFENSATIPDNYLECDKVEGEIAAGDEETAGRTSLYEVIDDDTRRSRVVNFTSVTRVGPLVIRQHKKIRCAVGEVVSKDIYEWPDGTENPKKRVEIKVGPTIRDLGSETQGESAACGTETFPKIPNETKSRSPSSSDCGPGESCETSFTCEDGECDGPVSSEESAPTTYPPDSNDLLAAGVTRRTLTKESAEILTLKKSSTSLPQKPDLGTEEDSCDEDDPDCFSGLKSTFDPDVDTETSERNADLQNVKGSGESCQDDSENCSCIGASCVIHSSEGPKDLEAGNKREDLTTVFSVKSNPTAGKSTINPSQGESGPFDEPKCDGESDECSESSSLEATGVKRKNKEPIDENAPDNEESAQSNEKTTSLENTVGQIISHHPRGTEYPEAFGSTEEPELSEASSSKESPPPCDSSESGDCATETSEMKPSSDKLPLRKHEKKSSPLQSTEFPSDTAENSEETTVPKWKDDEQSSSCDGSSNDENCKLTNSSHVHAPAWDSDSSLTASNSREFEEEPTFSTSDEHKEATYSLNQADTPKPLARSDEEISIGETTSSLPDSTRNLTLSEEDSTDCSSNSDSANCERKTTSSSLVNNKTTLPPKQGASSANSCEGSEDCGSTERTSDKTVTALKAATNSSSSTEEPEESTCNSCETPASGTSTEICGDGSVTGDCTSNGENSIPDACDSTSGSCSSESGDPNAEIIETSTSSSSETTSKEVENLSTVIDDISTTAETRRSTLPTLSLTSPPVKGRRRLALRIKVLLEHINENKEKQKLVQVEKHLMLNENPNEQGNHSLLWQIKSLNNSMNLETLKAIFNCSDFDKLTDGTNLTEIGDSRETRLFLRKKGIDQNFEGSMEENENEDSENSKERSDETLFRKKREITTISPEEYIANVTDIAEEDIAMSNITEEITERVDDDILNAQNATQDTTMRSLNVTEKLGGADENIAEEVVVKSNNMTEAKATAIRESLPGVEEDFKKGLDHVLSRITKEFDAPVKSGVGTAAESSSSILKILASPSDTRIHIRRRRATRKDEVAGSFESLKNPANGEEIDHWSNVRLVNAANGGKVRAVTEFRLLSDAVEDARRVPLGS